MCLCHCVSVCACMWFMSINPFLARVYVVFCIPVCQDQFQLFWVCLLKCSLLKDFRTNLLRFVLHVFSYTLAYDTVNQI